MRLLFSFAGGAGHFLPLVPFARAAAAAGHQVAVAGKPALARVVEAAGFDHHPIGAEPAPGTGARARLVPADMVKEAEVIRTFYAGTLARERADGLLEVAARWRPDAFVRDEMDFGAAVAAEQLGLPAATVLCIASGALAPRKLVAEPLNALREQHGLSPDPELQMLSRHLVLAPFPPSLRDPAYPLPPTAHSIRPLSGPSEQAPGWVADLSDAVYVTLGTIFNSESGDLFERVISGVARLPVDVVVTVGRDLDPAKLDPGAANVRVERYVPQSALLPRCGAVVSHAGSGSVVGALAHGLPMVLLPLGADQPLNAARCHELGVARVLDPVAATPDAVQAAVAEIRDDPRYRKAAGRIRDEIAALPPPESAVALLERLV